jgi:hypothetical protein
VSDYGLPVFSPEFAVYFAVGWVGFTALSLLLANSGLREVYIFGIGVLYGWFLLWFRRLAGHRYEARRRKPSREEVSP